MSNESKSNKVQIVFEDELVILVTGSRDWTDYDFILNIMKQYKDRDVLLIHGDCKGVDKLSGKASKELNFQIKSFPADWKRYGRGAGPIRNLEMIKQVVKFKEDGLETIVLAFHDTLESSKGTKHCVEQARKYGLSVVVHKH